MKKILRLLNLLLFNPFSLIIAGITILVFTLGWLTALGVILIIYGAISLTHWWVMDKLKLRLEKDGPISKN